MSPVLISTMAYWLTTHARTMVLLNDASAGPLVEQARWQHSSSCMLEP